MKGDDISKRLTDFAVRIIRLVKSLPNDFVGQHIGKQLLRSGTSAGANYEEARSSESSADFIHKLKISLKELRESIYWLTLITNSKLLTAKNMENIVQEASELSNILGKSIITARKNTNKKS